MATAKPSYVSDSLWKDAHSTNVTVRAAANEQIAALKAKQPTGESVPNVPNAAVATTDGGLAAYNARAGQKPTAADYSHPYSVDSHGNLVALDPNDPALRNTDFDPQRDRSLYRNGTYYGPGTASGGGGGTGGGGPPYPQPTDVNGNPIGGATGPGQGGAGTGVNAGLTTAQTNAFATVKAQLDQYGLGSLSTFVYNEIIAGRSAEEVTRDLRGTPEYAQRFPGIALREKAGLSPISPGEYVSYENAAFQQMREAGLPKGFYDSTDDFTQLIASNVSPSELRSRIDNAKQATYNIPSEVANRLHSELGLAPGSGALAAYFLDPNKAAPLLQAKFDAARIGGAADRTGYGLTNSQAEGLTAQGVTEAQAQQGFTTLAHNQPLFDALPGSGESKIGQDTQLGAAFGGNAAAQDQIEARRRAREAAFQDGGGFAASGKGLQGLGSSAN